MTEAVEDAGIYPALTREAELVVETPDLGRRHHLDDLHGARPLPAVVATDCGVVLAAVAGEYGWAAAGRTLAGVLAAALLAGLYADRDSVRTRGMLWYVRRILPVFAIATLLGTSFELRNAAAVLATTLLACSALVALRAVTWPVLFLRRKHGRGLRRTLVVGPLTRAAAVAAKLQQFPEAGLHPVAVAVTGTEGLAVGLTKALRDHPAEHVIVVPDSQESAYLPSTLHRCEPCDAYFSLLPPLSELFLRPASLTDVGGLPLMPLGRPLQPPSFPGKRLFDIVVASLLLLATAPALAAAAVAVKLDDGGPILYHQLRVGRNGRPFRMVKLRTMVPDADRRVAEVQAHNTTDGLLFKMRGDPRVTRIGRLLRRASVDELPQLVNVLRGEMSLVGPRPLPVPPQAFGELDSHRHTAPPGITGYWQISGGNGLTYDEMIKLDVAYIRNWSLRLDVSLLLRTIPALVHRRGPC